MGGLGRVQRLRSPVGGGRYGTPLIIIVSRAGVDEAGAGFDAHASCARARLVFSGELERSRAHAVPFVRGCAYTCHNSCCRW